MIRWYLSCMNYMNAINSPDADSFTLTSLDERSAEQANDQCVLSKNFEISAGARVSK